MKPIEVVFIVLVLRLLSEMGERYSEFTLLASAMHGSAAWRVHGESNGRRQLRRATEQFEGEFADHADASVLLVAIENLGLVFGL